jgi:hypothetical protein
LPDDVLCAARTRKIRPRHEFTNARPTRKPARRI